MKNQVNEWKNTPKNMNNPLHAICSYMAMFPANLPHHFIDKYSDEGNIILDPFSGRGTTVLEACLMRRIGIGNDKSPLAYVLTKSKSNIPQKGRIISRIEELEKKFNSCKVGISKEDQNIKMIFSNYTLKQLISLKNNLNWKKSNVDNFIAALVLGAIHGGSESYFSLRMPNTFSMSPNYVKNYIKKHGLKKPKREIFKILKMRLDRFYQKHNIKGKTFNKDARNLKKIKDSSVSLVITSPPYTRVIRYGQFNWIRLWFLGKKGKEVDKDLFFTQSLDKYTTFMLDSLKEMKRVLKTKGRAVLVIGDVRERITKKPFNLAGLIWKRAAKPLGFKLLEPILPDVISDDTKVSKIWGKTRGNATKIDRILVLEKN